MCFTEAELNDPSSPVSLISVLACTDEAGLRALTQDQAGSGQGPYVLLPVLLHVPVPLAGGASSAGETGPHHESSLSQTDPGQVEPLRQVACTLIGWIYFQSLNFQEKSHPPYLSVRLWCCQAGGVASPHPQLPVHCILDNGRNLCVCPQRVTGSLHPAPGEGSVCLYLSDFILFILPVCLSVCLYPSVSLSL